MFTSHLWRWLAVTRAGMINKPMLKQMVSTCQHLLLTNLRMTMHAYGCLCPWQWYNHFDGPIWVCQTNFPWSIAARFNFPQKIEKSVAPDYWQPLNWPWLKIVENLNSLVSTSKLGSTMRARSLLHTLGGKAVVKWLQDEAWGPTKSQHCSQLGFGEDENLGAGARPMWNPCWFKCGEVKIPWWSLKLPYPRGCHIQLEGILSFKGLSYPTRRY